MPLNERTVNSARNPKWTNYNHTAIELEVDFDELDEEYVDFCAHPDDIVSWGPDLFNRAIAGEFGAIAEFEIPEDITGNDVIDLIREERNSTLLGVVDPIVSNPLRWPSFSSEKQTEWSNYRQALLDLPETQSSAYLTFNTTTENMDWVNLNWPTQPSE
jgi:hypothetical protein